MSKKKVLLIMISLLFILGCYLGYKKYHYETDNAFYLSHKRGESIFDQQRALTKNINPDLMEHLDIEIMYQEKSSLLFCMTEVNHGVSYTFYPDAEGGSVIVTLREFEGNTELCSFLFEKNIKKIKIIDSKISGNQETFYKKQSVHVYKQIFKNVYENWEIQ